MAERITVVYSFMGLQDVTRDFLGVHSRPRSTFSSSTNPLGCFFYSCLPHTSLCHMPMLVPVLHGLDAIMDQASLVGAGNTFENKERFQYFPQWWERRYCCLNIKYGTRSEGF